MDKAILRKSTIRQLKNLSAHEKKRIDVQLITNLLSSDLWAKSETIGITIAQEFEWATQPIIEAGWQQNKRIVVPKCFPTEKELVFYEISTFHQLETVYFNLLEPNPDKSRYVQKSDIDLLVVPGVLFDRSGFRIGFGGGYYDRFLTDFKQKTVSLCSNSQLVNLIPKEEYDIPVQYIVTDTEIIHTKA